MVHFARMPHIIGDPVGLVKHVRTAQAAAVSTRFVRLFLDGIKQAAGLSERAFR
jgi:hypothetical protein